MTDALIRRTLTRRCILKAGHRGECEWNEFDPTCRPRCDALLAQIDGGADDGRWVRVDFQR